MRLGTSPSRSNGAFGSIPGGVNIDFKAKSILGPLGDLEWGEFDPKLATQDEVDRIEAPLLDFFRSITKAEFLEGACAREMLGYPVSTVADIATDPQLEAREFWQDLETPAGDRERHCGPFYVADHSRPALRNPAVDGSGDSARILRDFGFSGEEIAALSKQQREVAA